MSNKKFVVIVVGLLILFMCVSLAFNVESVSEFKTVVSNFLAELLTILMLFSQGTLAVYVIFFKIIMEFFLIKFYMGEKWNKAAILALEANIASAFIGVVIMPVRMVLLINQSSFLTFLLSEINIDLNNSFVHLLFNYILIFIINVISEGLVLRKYLKQRFKKFLCWLSIINTTLQIFNLNSIFSSFNIYFIQYIVAILEICKLVYHKFN